MGYPTDLCCLLMSTESTECLSDDQIRFLIDEVFRGRIPFNNQIGFEIDATDVDRIEVSFDMKETLVGNFMHGILHGGVTSSALDVVGGIVVFVAAARTMSSDKTPEQMREWFSTLATIDMRIDFLLPGAGRRFTATANVLRAGRRISVARMDLHNEKGQQIAAGTGTYTQPPPK